jgi:hypothetical protein
MTHTKKRYMGAVKVRDENSDGNPYPDFDLDEERLRAAENALGSHINNEALRNELSEKLYHYRLRLTLWNPQQIQAKTVSEMKKEAEQVMARIRNGGDLFSILNSKPYQKESDRDASEHARRTLEKHENTVKDRLEKSKSKPAGCDEPTKLERETSNPTKHNQAKRRKKKAAKLNSGISGELLTHLLRHGVDPETPDLAGVNDAFEKLLDIPTTKPGRPTDYSRDWFLNQLAIIFLRETGETASSSKDWIRGQGRFMDLCRPMLIPSDNFKHEDAETIGKAFERLIKRKNKTSTSVHAK